MRETSLRGRLQVWGYRTIGNWRWWVVLPLIPISLVGQALLTAGEEMCDLFKSAHAWQKKGWKG